MYLPSNREDKTPAVPLSPPRETFNARNGLFLLSYICKKVQYKTHNFSGYFQTSCNLTRNW